MNKILLFGTVIFSILAFSGYKAFAQLREENKQPAAAAPKILIAYYSYSGNTKEVAEAIHEKIGGDIFEIKTKAPCGAPAIHERHVRKGITGSVLHTFVPL